MLSDKEIKIMQDIEAFAYKYRKAIKGYASLSRWCGANKPAWYKVLVNNSPYFSEICEELQRRENYG